MTPQQLQQLQQRLQDATTIVGAQQIDLLTLRAQLAKVTSERDRAVDELVQLKAEKPSSPLSVVSTTQG